MHQDS